MSKAYADRELDPVFRVIAHRWIEVVRHAQRHKETVFQRAADECQQFYDGPKSWTDLMGSDVSPVFGDVDQMSLTFQVTLNKAFEYVSLFGPSLYQHNPNRTVRPRVPVSVPPMLLGANPAIAQSIAMQDSLALQVNGVRGHTLEAYLNWSALHNNLDSESRSAINEALIQGRGCLWTELYQPPGSPFRVVRSTFDPVRNLIVDPDADRIENASWIARRRVRPAWKVEREYGLRPGSLHRNLESHAVQSQLLADESLKYDRARGFSGDLVVYWQIWSKMGIGGRLPGVRRAIAAPLEMFGDFVHIAVAENTPFLLNMGPDLVNDPSFSSDSSRVFDAVAWPIPLWAGGGWPVATLDFFSVPDSPWPRPPLRAAMGELKFLNWAISFLMGKLRNSSRDFLVMRKSASEEMKQAVLEGRDLTLLELEADHPGTIRDIVDFLQHPQVNGDMWRLIEIVETLFDKRVGLNELMYGQTRTQIRSAQEAEIRNQNTSVRPDDMSHTVEEWQSRVAANEAIAARYHLHSQDVSQVIGQLGGWVWDQLVHTKDPVLASHQLEYRIESGSTRRPNKSAIRDQATESMQAIGPLLQQYATATGDLGPLNNLLYDFAESRDVDPSRYQLRAIPVQPQVNPGADSEGGEGGESQDQTPRSDQ